VTAPLILDATFLSEARDAAGVPAPIFPEIAFAGRSNVGKSSLINRLVARKQLVRTSGNPGCTRGINMFRLKLRIDENDAEIDLVDLPGYGYAKRSKTERKAWGSLIEDFLRERPGLRAVVVIVDVRRGVEEEDAQLLDFLRDIGRPALLVVTKTDKLPANQRKLAVQKCGRDAGLPVYGFSAVTGDGRDRLWGRLMKLTGIGVA